MKNDRLLGLFALVFGLALFPATSGFPGAATNRPGPAFLPRVLAVLFCLCGLLLILTPPQEKQQRRSAPPRAWLKVTAVISGMILFVAVVEHVGYMIAAGVLTFAIFLILGNPILTSIIATLILVPGTYLLFSTLLGVVLPIGWFGW